ncbi:CBD9-like protein [Westerdykella ornata]|uniref:CBD9-like protein n=1 Tax=Westerdykella ornata TaxID=318751 RepID=A0A6A6JFB1_WESOR|nr:CBD9-like protein [Westerdykella ornata]KAF2274316.1 CBD9-like protein [Westerdykella ornata]
MKSQSLPSAVFVIFLPFVLLAASQAETGISSFVHATQYGNITFAATLARDGDLFFHLEAPAANSWAAVGIGEGMKGSLIWVFYRNDEGNGVTLCSRTTDGNVEPAHVEGSNCVLYDGPGVENGVFPINETDFFVANVRCKDIVSPKSNTTTVVTTTTNSNSNEVHKRPTLPRVEYTYPHPYIFPKLSSANPSQAFIFALGPTDRKLRSNNKGAPIRRHSLYGHFRLDLSAATVSTAAEVPYEALGATGTWQNRHAQLGGGLGAEKNYSTKRDRGGWEGTIHAILMTSTMVILFPVGVVFLRLVEKVRPHAVMQAIGCVFVIVGMAIGIWAGGKYNQTKRISQPHQIIGFVVVAFTLFQFTLGISQHLLSKKPRQHAGNAIHPKNRPNVVLLRRIHVPLGSLILIAGAVNGFLGFLLTANESLRIIYAAMVGFVAVGLVVALTWIRAVKRKERRRIEERSGIDEGSTYQNKDGVEAEKDQRIAQGDREMGILEMPPYGLPLGYSAPPVPSRPEIV